jgi:uncharacterized protein (DUF433 family)
MSQETSAEIVKTPGVLSGKARLAGKRVGVRMIGDMIRDGEWTHEEVVEELRLTRAEVDAALAYYDAHPGEMDAEREADEAALERIREQSRAPGT